MQHTLYRIWSVRDESLVLPKGEWKRFEDYPELLAKRKELREETLGRLSRFGMAFSPSRWETLTINPVMQGETVAYWGVYGETIVVEGQFYINDVVDGDHCFVSPSDQPFWCLHRGVFETNDHELYRRLLTLAPGLPDKDEPDIMLVPWRLVKAAALYIIQKAGAGKLSLEANRETRQCLVIGTRCKKAVYECWNKEQSELLSSTRFGSADAASDFLINKGFIKITDDYQAEGILAERLLRWLSREKPPATIKDLSRLVKL